MITPQLEKLILAGAAEFKQFSFAYTDFNVIAVPSEVTCIVLAYDFTPARVVRYGMEPAIQTVQRVEFANQKKYYHQFFKMQGNDDPFIRVDSLYYAFQSDFGVMVTIPKNEELNYDIFQDFLDSSSNPSAERVLNVNTNPIDTTPQFSLKGTRSNGANTTNIPSNNGTGSENYSDSFQAGFIANEISQYNWISENLKHVYNGSTNYSNVGPAQLMNGWYLTVKCVFINKELSGRLL